MIAICLTNLGLRIRSHQKLSTYILLLADLTLRNTEAVTRYDWYITP